MTSVPKPEPTMRWLVSQQQVPSAVNIKLGELWGRLQTRELVGYSGRGPTFQYSEWKDLHVDEVFPA